MGHHGVDIVKDREINTKVVMVTSSTLECVIMCSHLVVTTSTNKWSRSITLQRTTSAWWWWWFQESWQRCLARRKNQMMLFYDPLATIGGWQTGSVIADNLWSKIAESQTLLMVNYRWKVEVVEDAAIAKMWMLMMMNMIFWCGLLMRRHKLWW